MPFTKGHTSWKHPNSIKTQFQKGGAGHLGFQHSEISNEKNRIAHLGTKLGEENPSWRGGITPFLNKIKRFTEYKTWQREIMERDNFTCRKCRIRGGDLTAHHLTSFSFLVNTVFEIRTLKQARDCFALWKIRHGVTLCKNCHKETPNFGWRANNAPRDRTIYPAILGIILFTFFVFPSFSQAATFGYTSIGATNFSSIAREVGDFSQTVGQAWTLSEAGTLDSLHAGLIAQNANDTVDTFIAIYREDSAGANSHDLVASTETSELSITTTASFYTMTAASESLSNDDYILAVLGNGEDVTVSSDNIFIRADSGADPDKRIYQESTTGAGGYATRKAENPWTEVDATSDFIFSIYATYTATGGAVSSPKIQLKSSVQFKSSVQLK